MAQNDIQITTTPPLAGLTLVQGVNGALQSLATDFAGSIDPAAIGGVGPYCTWADTGNGLLKRRNAAGTDWVVEGKLLANNSAAENIDYDNAASGLAAETVQDAVDELTSEKLYADKNIVLGTAVAATGTAIDFTGIPSTAKRVTLMISGVSTTVTGSTLTAQIGAGAVVTSGYLGTVTNVGGAESLMGIGHYLVGSTNESSVVHGNLIISKVSPTVYTLVGSIAYSNGAVMALSSSSVNIGGSLGIVRLTTFTGTSLFDAGTVNISWE